MISHEGWRTVFLIRMTPLSFSFASYLLGVTSIKLKDYFLGSIAIVFHVALWLYIGKSLDRFSEIKKRREANEADEIEYLVLCLEILIAFSVAIMVSYKAKKILDK